MATSTPPTQEPRLDKPRHIKYWQRCHSSYLPSAYTSNDSTRVTFAFFIISALDLLSVPLTPEDRSAIRRWVLSLQHPDGGFCGSPTHALPGEHAHHGSANLAATFFALALLGIAAETDEEQRNAFSGVNRKTLLGWLKKLQRQDGSFGQVLLDGEPLGGRDMRHSYLASAIRWMLRGPSDKVASQDEDDIDVEKTLEHISSVQTYDGGMSESAQQESHGGYVYCGIAALLFLDRTCSLEASGALRSSPPEGSAMHRGLKNREELIHFLAYRQFAYKATEEAADEDQENYLETKLGGLSLGNNCSHVGFNGRWNKKADTCYTWWAGATLHILEGEPLYNSKLARNYLLDITQHAIGGFSKSVGGPPDIYHSYLGLTALSMMGDHDVKPVDLGLCCSQETVQKITRARDGMLAASKAGQDSWGSDGFWEDASKPI